jgi:murein L,D-transpeptidase YafK
VPEGVYPIESLNPNSRFHVALRVGYPSPFDRRNAEREGRTQLGGDIMIHGGAASIGCLAMGDPVAEELFVLAAGVGVERVHAVLSPVDLRKRPMPERVDTTGWRGELYDTIRAAFVSLTP